MRGHAFKFDGDRHTYQFVQYVLSNWKEMGMDKDMLSNWTGKCSRNLYGLAVEIYRDVLSDSKWAHFPDRWRQAFEL